MQLIWKKKDNPARNRRFRAGLSDSLLYMIKFCRLKLFYGIVYASGSELSGRLGYGITDYHNEFTPIPINEPTDMSEINWSDKLVYQVGLSKSDTSFC